MNPSLQRTIGLLIAPYSENNRGIIQGVLNYVRTHHDLRVDQRKALPHLPWNELSSWQGHGVIAMAHTRHHVRALLRKGLPAINVSSQVKDRQIPSVHADDELMGQLAAEELLAAGLSRFAFVGRMAWPNHENRCKGFQGALAKNNHSCTTINIQVLDWTMEGTEQIEVDIPQLAKKLARLPMPVGIAAGNDLFAYAIADACKEIGAQVPFDVAIVGNGNLRLVCESTDPPLSSVAHGSEQIGFEAAHILHRMIKGDASASKTHLKLPPEGVVQRRSTDFFAVDDPLVLKALRIIKGQVGERLTTSYLAQEVGVSRRLLNTRFQHAIGHSPGEEIRKARLRKAKSLLTNGVQTIEEISFQCGFENASGFVRSFRNEIGVTPGQYRRKLRATSAKSTRADSD
jgi:LacI family transcriptional regulator